MHSNDTKDYLYSRQHEYVKQIENKVKIACGAYVAAAVLILILPIRSTISALARTLCVWLLALSLWREWVNPWMN